ncbi:hypothetical protein BJ138DRAFT_110587 [Hygrophoropsis aurantiaca]|uniref:Uncharacterized protein n=1 Tax=Hygrophoropsis aurantiaca TaxID=72124 RepID=A0ACB8ABH8_9AGAM|nr:hypothetical protein BJ138DRAFT_110587 [Hygrophoropsis aurantiaca]
MAGKLPPQAQRLRMIIVTVPIIGATSYVLYDRLVNGKPRRTLPQNNPVAQPKSSEFLVESTAQNGSGLEEA